MIIMTISDRLLLAAVLHIVAGSLLIGLAVISVLVWLPVALLATNPLPALTAMLRASITIVVLWTMITLTAMALAAPAY